jgi:hypothetical protein
MGMEIIGKDFSSASVRSYIQSKRKQADDERRAYEAAQREQREKLHKEFSEREVQPEALQRVATLVEKAVDCGEKHVLLFQFPSDWLSDGGRSITSQDPNWPAKLDGFAQRAYAFYERELAPRGFRLRAQIVDWPGGMPGDVGFYLSWPMQEEV